MRCDPPAITGCVNWPTHTSHVDTGEGGMWVYAYITDRDAPDFEACYGPTQTVTLAEPDALIHDPGQIHGDDCRILAAVCLGSTGGSWVATTPQGDHIDYWQCAASDLTTDGRNLVAALERMFGAPVHICTYLDT